MRHSQHKRSSPWRCQLSLTHSPNLHNSLIARIPVTTGRTLAEWFHRLESGPAFLRREERAHWLADDAGHLLRLRLRDRARVRDAPALAPQRSLTGPSRLAQRRLRPARIPRATALLPPARPTRTGYRPFGSWHDLAARQVYASRSMADGAHRRAGRHDGAGLTRLPDRHIAHGIPGQKCRDLAIHILRCGHSGHLRPALELPAGIIVSAGAALAIGTAWCGFAAQFGQRIG